jgi:hypothetical protein
MSAAAEFDRILQDAGLLGALARAGQLRRAAQELAQDEYEAGIWVDERELEDDAPLRLAADDGQRATSFTDGTLEVRLAPGEDGALHATQLDGPAGVTLLIGERYLPLVPGAAAATDLRALPERLIALDARGRRRTLRPR